MIKFDKPLNLNGAELLEELKNAGVKITNYPTIDGNGGFWLEIDAADEAKAKPIVAAHNGTTIAPEPTIEDKLANVGLNINNLKAALGLE